MSTLKEKVFNLKHIKKLHGPDWLLENSSYLCQMGSVSYGVSNDVSDIDIYGITIPPIDDIFPHLRGDIPGFSTSFKQFGVYSQDHIINDDREYDIAIYGITRYFRLLLDNNPNIIDSIFVPDRCIIHMDGIGEHIRENRHKFLSNNIIPKIRGYAYSQMAGIKNNKSISNPKRQALIEKYGYDVKFAYQCVRILLEGEQLITEGTLDLERNSSLLIGIRKGEWTFEFFQKWFDDKIIEIENLRSSSKLANEVSEEEIKTILMECIEMKYGTISKSPVVSSSPDIIIDLKSLIRKYDNDS